jgi:hypothetical protein
MQVLQDVTAPSNPAPFISRSQSGKIKTRETGTAGVEWAESYGQISFRNPETHEFLSYIAWAWRNGLVFDIDHPLTPGSGEPHLGNATAGLSVTVSGGSQAGDTLVTAGWTPSTSNLLLPGTVIKVAGIDRVFRVTDPVSSNGSGVASISIDPIILTGSSPSSGAAVTYNNVKYKAILSAAPNLPNVDNTFYYNGLTLQFTEAV